MNDRPGTRKDSIGIVLDTTTLRGKKTLVLSRLRLLSETAARAGVPIRIPIVAAAEAHRTGVNEVKNLVRGIEKAAQGLTKYGLPVPEFEAPSDDEIKNRVANTIEGAAAGADFAFLDVPDVSHKDLVRRDLRQTKPFNSSGKGYRDALIWLAAIKWAKETELGYVYFVSNNSKDYAGSDGSLDPSLAHEAEVAGLAVTLVDTIDTLIAEHLGPRLEPVAENIGAPLKDAFPAAAEAIAHAVSSKLASVDSLAELGDDAPDDSVVDADPPQVGTVEWARRLEDGSTLVQVLVKVYVISLYEDPDPRDPAHEYSSGDIRFRVRAVIEPDGKAKTIEVLPIDHGDLALGALSQDDELRLVSLAGPEEEFWPDDE